MHGLEHISLEYTKIIFMKKLLLNFPLLSSNYTFSFHKPNVTRIIRYLEATGTISCVQWSAPLYTILLQNVKLMTSFQYMSPLFFFFYYVHNYYVSFLLIVYLFLLILHCTFSHCTTAFYVVILIICLYLLNFLNFLLYIYYL